jgi:hypothetical protein
MATAPGLLLTDFRRFLDCFGERPRAAQAVCHRDEPQRALRHRCVGLRAVPTCESGTYPRRRRTAPRTAFFGTILAANDGRCLPERTSERSISARSSRFALV